MSKQTCTTSGGLNLRSCGKNHCHHPPEALNHGVAVWVLAASFRAALGGISISPTSISVSWQAIASTLIFCQIFVLAFCVNIEIVEHE